MKKTLVTITNHPVHTWSDEQKAGWDAIIELPFPHISAELESTEVEKIAHDVYRKVKTLIEKYENVYVYAAGEYTFSYMFLLLCARENVNFVVPTSNRIIEDGKHVFKFVQWRELNFKGGEK